MDPDLTSSAGAQTADFLQTKAKIESALEDSHVFLTGAERVHQEQYPFQGAGARPKTTLGQRKPEPPKGFKNVGAAAMSTPRERTPDRGSERLLYDSVREAVDNYMTTRSSGERCKVPPVIPPKFVAGGDWRCFLADFEEMVQLADLQPSMQLAYFKQAIPEEAKRMLYQHKVDNVREAKQLLQELYEPKKDKWTVLEELKRIKQKPGERLRVLAGRIEEMAHRYAETLEMFSARDLSELISERFKQAIADEETRNHLLWDTRVTTLDDMVKTAQRFQDARQIAVSEKRAMRGQEPETESLKRQVQELRRQIEVLKQAKSPTVKGRICWNCGQQGHVTKKCPKPKVQDGHSYHPKNLKKRKTLN